MHRLASVRWTRKRTIEFDLVLFVIEGTETNKAMNHQFRFWSLPRLKATDSTAIEWAYRDWPVNIRKISNYCQYQIYTFSIAALIKIWERKQNYMCGSRMFPWLCRHKKVTNIVGGASVFILFGANKHVAVIETVSISRQLPICFHFILLLANLKPIADKRHNFIRSRLSWIGMPTSHTHHTHTHEHADQKPNDL